MVGYWGGERADQPNALEPEVAAFTRRRHILTLSEDLLGSLHIRQGPMSLFEWESVNEHLSYRAEADWRLRFADLSFSGTPLYATQAASFPPFAALCLDGGEAIGLWLQAQGLARHDYWRIDGDELPQSYEAEWQGRSPFYDRDGADAIVGGWHWLWPDDDFYMPPEVVLAALTLRDAEPWLEVWHSPGKPRLAGHGAHILIVLAVRRS